MVFAKSPCITSSSLKVNDYHCKKKLTVLLLCFDTLIVLDESDTWYLESSADDRKAHFLGSRMGLEKSETAKRI